MTPSVSEIQGVDDSIINDFGSVGGIKTDKRKRNTLRKPAPVPLYPS
jgi:hypothetical protein